MVADTGKITSKGQVTIPRSIRERFGLREGTRILFEETSEGELRIRSLGAEDPLGAWRALQQAVSVQAKAEGLTEEDVARIVEKAREEVYREVSAKRVG